MSENSTAPVWLNEHFLEKNLRNHFKNDEINVINYNIKANKGKEGSSVYWVTVSFGVSLEGEENCHLIVKEASTDGNAFSKEILFYEEIVPKFNEKLGDIGEPELFPEVYGVCKEKNLLILGDLSAKGYEVSTAHRGYNVPEAKVILKRLALFHAISAVVQEENSDIFANFKTGHLSRNVNGLAENLKILTDVISEWSEFGVYAEKLRHLYDEIIERVHQTYDVNSSHFNSLNHDGLRREHLMVVTENSSEENLFDNVVLVGLKNSYWGSPTIDLHYFLNTSIDEAYRPQHFEELVQFYHEHLVNFLKQLKYKNRIPTWTEFQKQFHERRILDFIFSCLIDETEVGLQTKRDFYKDDKVQAKLRKLIPYYNTLGTFE